MDEITRRDVVKSAALSGGLMAVGASQVSGAEKKGEAGGAGTDKKVVPYVSAFTAGKLVHATGKASETRKALESALRAQQIDTQPALRNLAAGEPGDVEAVSRLIALARGNGFCVELTDSAAGKVDFKITLPKDVGMLQSGHHRVVG